MNRHLFLVTALVVLLASCGVPAVLFPVATPTPTVVGTWETAIKGRIYDGSTGPEAPLGGASVSYIVLHSYFLGLQEGRPNVAVTNLKGEFLLPVVVHDTDSIRILVEAQGYQPYEERLVGVDLLPGRTLDIGLTPE